jgi:hypothetical protein
MAEAQGRQGLAGHGINKVELKLSFHGLHRTGSCSRWGRDAGSLPAGSIRALKLGGANPSQPLLSHRHRNGLRQS